MFHRRTIHIDIKYNFICDKIESKRITLIDIATIDNPTDVMTKPLPCAKFSLCVDLIGLKVKSIGDACDLHIEEECDFLTKNCVIVVIGVT